MSFYDSSEEGLGPGQVACIVCNKYHCRGLLRILGSGL